MKHLPAMALLLLVLAMGPSAAQAGPSETSSRGSGYCCAPPRYQIFDAPKPYGGPMMVDTQTGQTWQRIKINTPKGIRLLWLKVPMVDDLPEGQTILWD